MTQERAVLAGGCFWGLQDLIRRQGGVISTRVGYTGGDVPNAMYRNHGTHVEAIEIVFDPARISYRRLLEFFFQIHDPTTRNRQGNDIGTSYRSAIFYTSEEQKGVAEDAIADVDASGLWPGRVVTEIAPAGDLSLAQFWPRSWLLSRRRVDQDPLVGRTMLQEPPYLGGFPVSCSPGYPRSTCPKWLHPTVRLVRWASHHSRVSRKATISALDKFVAASPIVVALITRATQADVSSAGGGVVGGAAAAVSGTKIAWGRCCGRWSGAGGQTDTRRGFLLAWFSSVPDPYHSSRQPRGWTTLGALISS